MSVVAPRCPWQGWDLLPGDLDPLSGLGGAPSAAIPGEMNGWNTPHVPGALKRFRWVCCRFKHSVVHSFRGKRGRLSVFWSRRAQTPRDHVPSLQLRGVMLLEAILGALAFPPASVAPLRYGCHSPRQVNKRIVSAGGSERPPHCLLKILFHFKEMTGLFVLRVRNGKWREHLTVFPGVFKRRHMHCLRSFSVFHNPIKYVVEVCACRDVFTSMHQKI